jgi:hypothetical protein
MTKSSWQRNASRIGNAAKPDPRTGSRFDDFLKEEGMFEEVQAKALKRALAEQLEESMQAGEADEVGHGKEDGDQPLAARPGVGSKQRFGSVGYTDQSTVRSRQRDRDQDQTRAQKGGGMNGALGTALAGLLPK